jgi:hypothetical protein
MERLRPREPMIASPESSPCARQPDGRVKSRSNPVGYDRMKAGSQPSNTPNCPWSRSISSGDRITIPNRS